MGVLYRHGEFLHQEEGEIIGHAGNVEVFGEDQHRQNEQGRADFPPGQAGGRRRRIGRGAAGGRAQPAFVPAADPDKDENGQQGGQCKPADRPLAEGDHDQGSQQGTRRASGVTAHLEDGLCQPFPSARRELGHTGRFGMEDRRTPTDQRYGEQNRGEPRSDRKQEQAREREAHAESQRVRTGMPVRKGTHDRLQKGGGHLEDQRDDADLGEGEAEPGLQQRIDGRNHGLHHVVEQMRRTDHQQNRIYRFPGRRGGGNADGGRESVHAGIGYGSSRMRAIVRNASRDSRAAMWPVSFSCEGWDASRQEVSS